MGSNPTQANFLWLLLKILQWCIPYIYIWLIISSCCGSIPLTLGLIGRDGGLNTLCHSCGFACQQRVLNTLPGPGYLHSEDGVVWLWHSVAVVNLYIYTYIYIYLYIYIYIYIYITFHSHSCWNDIR